MSDAINSPPLTLPTAATGTYIWQVPGKPISVHLNLDCVERLQQELSYAAGQEMPGSIQGILLGRCIVAPHPVVMVDDYELSRENRLTETSLRQGGTLLDMINRWPAVDAGKLHAVGFFRSQGAGWLGLSAEDLAISKRLSPGDIVLLIRSVPGQRPAAGFFVREEGGIQADQSDHEFPFDANILRKQGALVKRGSVQPKIPGEAKTAASSLPPYPAPNRQRSPWVWVSAVFALAGILSLVAALFLVRSNRDSDRNASEEALFGPQNLPLGLKVDRTNRLLEVLWNNGSAIVKTADQGTLTITDGYMTKEIPLDKTQLMAGHVYYEPLSGDISVRIEVTGLGRTNSESVQVFAEPAPLSPANLSTSVSSSPGPSQAPGIKPSPPVQQTSVAKLSPVTKQSPPPQPAAAEPKKEAATSVMLPARAPLPSSNRAATTNPAPSVPENPVQTAPAQPPPVSVAPPPRPESPPAASVPTPPAASQNIELPTASVVGNSSTQPQPAPLPGSRTAPKSPPLPAAAIFNVAPVTPMEVIRSLTQATEVHVTATLDEAGKVTRVDVDDVSKKVNGFLVQAALNAARKWKFRPAQLNGKTVPSTYNITFRFRPASQ